MSRMPAPPPSPSGADAGSWESSPPAAATRHQTVGEEIANSISHGAALLAALVATPFLVISAVRHGDTADIVGVSVFAATMVLLYFTSMLYHALPGGRAAFERALQAEQAERDRRAGVTAPRPEALLFAARMAGVAGAGLSLADGAAARLTGRAKSVFQILDHSAIYLLIAGTYTPFALGVLRGPWGWTLFGLVWAMAAAGVVLKAVAGVRYPRLSTALYLGMGWIAVIAIKPMWQLIPAWGLFWLVAGGLAYTLGVVFFTQDSRWHYAHFIWHLFVAAGTACHVVAVMFYAI